MGCGDRKEPEGWDVVSLQKKSKSTPGREKLEAGVDRYVRP